MPRSASSTLHNSHTPTNTSTRPRLRSNNTPTRAMASAAARVFALPELLETILLNLSWRDLFSIFRTYSPFLNTIMRSSKLRRSMHLEYKLPGDEPGTDVPEYRTHHSIINDLYISRELDLWPFKGPRTEVRRYWQLDGQDPRRTFAINFRMPSSEFFKNTCIGISTRLRAREEASPSSWRAMKLTHLREPFRVVIQVRPPLGTRKCSHSQQARAISERSLIRWIGFGKEPPRSIILAGRS